MKRYLTSCNSRQPQSIAEILFDKEIYNNQNQAIPQRKIKSQKKY